MLTGLALLSASVPASAQTLTWSVVPSPSPGTSSNFLHGVSCASAAACTAVGSKASFGGTTTLIESWNGTRWSVVPSPNPAGSEAADLAAVSCASAAACTAAGGYQNSSGVARTLIESWNGARWSVVPSPSPGSGSDALSAVSCVSAAACTAVGGQASGTLIESWDGTRWSVMPNPGSAADVVGGVSCVSVAACTAVGYSTGRAQKTFIESWDGTRWSVVPSPNVVPHNYLDGVSCASPAACTAVGFYLIRGDHRTLIESWNGTSWSVVPSPNLLHNDHLEGVSCASAAGCTAVGYYRYTSGTLIESGTAGG